MFLHSSDVLVSNKPVTVFVLCLFFQFFYMKWSRPVPGTKLTDVNNTISNNVIDPQFQVNQVFEMTKIVATKLLKNV